MTGPPRAPKFVPQQRIWWNRAIIRAVRVGLVHTEAVDGQYQDVAVEPGLRHPGEVAQALDRRVGQLDLLEDHVGEGRRPRRVHRLEAGRIEGRHGRAVLARYRL